MSIFRITVIISALVVSGLAAANDQARYPQNSLAQVTALESSKSVPSFALEPVAAANATPSNETAQDANWLGQAQQALAQREYHASVNDKGLQAPNRSQGFRTYFDQSGITVLPRETDADENNGEEFTLSLHSFGRAGRLQKAKTGEVTQQQNKVVIDRGAISEWYINSEQGLEQGFDIAKRPKGKGALSVNLKLEGASAEQAGEDISLRTAKQSYRYSKLLVLDANKKTIPAQMLATSTGIAISVDDQHAQYPLTIDPLISATADVVLESNQAGAQFGFSVAGAGDVNSDGFADVIVGANQYDSGQFNEGAAFIFFGGIGAFDTTPDVQLESNQGIAELGGSVASAGDVNGDGYVDVIVGARDYSNGQSREGAAFIYLGGAGVFDTNADAQLESNQNNAGMGRSVAGAGDVNGDGYDDVIVGAWTYNNSQLDEGAAFIYFGGAGAFNTTADAQLVSTNQANAYLGFSVAGAGDVNGDGYADVIVGAPYYNNGQTLEGAAFIYFGGAGAFDTSPDAQLESNQAYAQLGSSVAGAGYLNADSYADVIVGAFGFTNGQDGEGAAFIYYGGAGVFNTTPDAQLESNQSSATQGVSVAGAGDLNGDGYADVIVGASGFDSGESNEGAAFIYFGGAGGFASSPDVLLEGNQTEALLGLSVAGIGDVNGDGYDDVIVGAPLYDNVQFNVGAALIHIGGLTPTVFEDGFE